MRNNKLPVSLHILPYFHIGCCKTCNGHKGYNLPERTQTKTIENTTFLRHGRTGFSINQGETTQFNSNLLCNDLYISSGCYPFEKNPFISNLAGQRTNQVGLVRELMSVVGSEHFEVVFP